VGVAGAGFCAGQKLFPTPNQWFQTQPLHLDLDKNRQTQTNITAMRWAYNMAVVTTAFQFGEK